ncbi:hypothetical protein [Diaphorobacter ruginosibacter]|uniref:hypothetical protein n=1 Tax=Diaphorobacter ruginosibacter TaxID=1715720 RepID=UPI00333E60E3
MLYKIMAAGALAALASGCVAIDDPYYQGGYGYGSYATYTSYPAWQGPGYYYDGGYYPNNPGISGAIYIRSRDDWYARDTSRRSDWERRRDQERRDANRRRDEANRAAAGRRDPVRPLPSNNPQADRDFNRSERILRQQESRQLNSPDPRVNRERAAIFERQRQQREEEQRKKQNPWGTGNSQGN